MSRTRLQVEQYVCDIGVMTPMLPGAPANAWYAAGPFPPGPAAAFAVTIEPTGGVPAPTGEKVLLGVPTN